MKFVTCLTFAAVINFSPASAAVEECRFIQAKADREACYHRQETALAARQKALAADNAQPRNVDEMKLEDDRLARQLRSICRGC